VSGEDRLFLIGCFFTLGVVLKEVCSIRVIFALSCFGASCLLVLARLLSEDPESLRMHIKWAACASAAMLLGLLAMNACAFHTQSIREIASLMSSQVQEIQGVITDMPEVDDEGKWKAILMPDAVMSHSGRRGTRILLTGTTLPESSLKFQRGHIVRASGRFYLPGAPLNPGEPDMRRIMACRGLDGTLYVETENDIGILGWRKPNLLQRAGDSFRDAVVASCYSTLMPRHARILTGMLLGNAPSHLRPALEATGTSHLFAASGLHVGYVSLAVMALIAPFRIPTASRFVFACVFIWIYAVACNLRASIVRAALMFSFVSLPKMLGRKISPRSALVLASLVMFTLNPYFVFDVSSQLSFLTVLSITHLYPVIRRLLHPLGYRLSEAFAMSISAQIGVAPVVVWYFGVFAPIGIIGNIPCIILAGLAVLIGLSATIVNLVFPLAASALNAGNSLVLLGLETTIGLLAKVPFGAFALKRPPLWSVLVYYLCIVIAGAPARLRRAIYARRNMIALLILTFCVGIVAYQIMKRPEVEIAFLAAGQGDAIFLQSAGGKSFLIDGGGVPGSTRDPGRDTILPFLKRKGIRYIDAVVLTHPHYDHIKGLFAVIDSCRVGLLIKPKVPEYILPDIDHALVSLADERNVPLVELGQGSSIDVGDGVRIFVLNPGADTSCKMETKHTSAELNAMSLVMRMEFAEFTLLLTGDAGEAQLDTILSMGEDLGASVLKVPHHGARDALNPEIINSVRPQVSVISVGPNAFSHPALATVTALEEAGSIVFRTDLDGAVIVRSDGQRSQVRSVASQRVLRMSQERGLR
jgi:competence protein ComEC